MSISFLVIVHVKGVTTQHCELLMQVLSGPAEQATRLHLHLCECKLLLLLLLMMMMEDYADGRPV